MTRHTPRTRSRRRASACSRRSIPRYRSVFADLLGERIIATGVPVEQIDKKFQPGDLNFVARTKDAYVYENPRALPRVMMVGDWTLAKFDNLIANGWPADVDPTKTVLLEAAPHAAPLGVFESAGTARLVRYANTEIVVETDSPSGGLLAAQRCLAPVVARDDRRRRSRHPARKRDFPRGRKCRRENSPCASPSSRCAGRGRNCAQSCAAASARNPETPCRARWCCGARAQAARPRFPARSRA